MSVLVVLALLAPLAGGVAAVVVPARRRLVGAAALGGAGLAWGAVLLGGGDVVGGHLVVGPLAAAAALGAVLVAEPRLRTAPPGYRTLAGFVAVTAATAAPGLAGGARPGLAGLALAAAASATAVATPGGSRARRIGLALAVVGVTAVLATVGPGPTAALTAVDTGPGHAPLGLGAAGILLAALTLLLVTAATGGVGGRRRPGSARPARPLDVVLLPAALGTALLVLPLVPDETLVADVTLVALAAAGVAVVVPVVALLALRAGDRVGAVALGLAGLAVVAGLAGGARSAVLVGAAAVLVLVLRTPLAAVAAVPGFAAGTGVALLGGAPAVVLVAGAAVAVGVTTHAVRGEAERVQALLARRAGGPIRRVPLAPPGRVPVRPERDPGWLAAAAIGIWLVLAPGTWDLGAGPPSGTAGPAAYRLAVAVVALTALGAAAVIARVAPERLDRGRLAAWLPAPLDRAPPAGRDRGATAVAAALTAGFALAALVAL